MKLLRETIAQGRFVLNLDASQMDSILEKSLAGMVAHGWIDPDHSDGILKALLDRERESPTAIGHASAIPHAYTQGIDRPLVYFIRLARPVNLDAPDGIPTRFFFLLLGPPESAAEHLDTMANIARLMADDTFRYDAQEARNKAELLQALDRFATRTAPEYPPRVDPEEGLRFTGRFTGGVLADLKRRGACYASDFRDGLNSKCVGATLFMFFACLAPAVTFGGVMAIQTQGAIGVVEMLVATAFCGLVYALFAGQPLIILGGTGPLLIITAMLYQLCGDLDIPFLPMYAWVGLWSSALIMVLALTDASCLMRYFTRFTDEIFSALISLIFIYEAVHSLVRTFQDLDVNKHHDTALLSLLLALGTYFIAMNLSRMRRGYLLRSWIREFLADFGPSIAIGSMTLVALWLHEIDLDILPVPEHFGTTSGRPWTVDLGQVPGWARIAALGPALLVTVLIFLDQNISSRLVNSPDHRLTKGPAYHLDLAVVGLLTGICSLFGLPWLVAATVRSLNHVHSLATKEEVIKPEGTTREHILHVQENRVTGLAIHLLIGCTLMLLPWLKTIPMAVLHGLFLYMGIVSMVGNQFFERLSFWWIDPDLQPTTHYTRRLPKRTIQLFTILQLACLVVLWLVKTSSLAIVFPLFIALLVPVRLLAGRFFDKETLAALDAAEEPEAEETHWTA